MKQAETQSKIQPETRSDERDNRVVLAFSGGLDTSFCVPYLIERGYRVATVFVDSGGVSEADKTSIKNRALELGAFEHHDINIAQQLWEQVITPLIQSGQWYQGQYPLLCSDRYLIVESCLKLCEKLGIKKFAHGCTGMGNDQVRFDLSVHCLGNYQIISPIREIQKKGFQVRDYEKQYLIEKGFTVSDAVSQYSINQNLLGATVSGSEIDQWKNPGQDSYVLTTPPGEISKTSSLLSLTFCDGVLSEINQKKIGSQLTGPDAIHFLNTLAGEYAIGRGIYTGDTTIGLKGRIVFEAPALQVINVAHTALEHTVLSKAQNRFKSDIGKKWTELVYEGFFYDPLKNDLEAFLQSSQKRVSGTVILQLSAGQAHAVEIDSPNILHDKQSVYAQSAEWSVEDAVGFIKLFGKSSVLFNQQQVPANSSQSNSL